MKFRLSIDRFEFFTDAELAQLKAELAPLKAQVSNKRDTLGYRTVTYENSKNYTSIVAVLEKYKVILVKK